MVLAASRKNRMRFFKVATLQKLAHLQPCNVPFSGSDKVWTGLQGCPFQRQHIRPLPVADTGRICWRSGRNSAKRTASKEFRDTARGPALSRLPARSVLLPTDAGRGRHRRPAPLGERKTCLQVAFLTGLPVKSAFALLLARVTEPRKNDF